MDVQTARNRRDARWHRLVALYRDGDQAARERLVAEMMPMVRQLAARYAGRTPREDLIQAGLLGLTKAIDRFDPSRGHALSGYAVPTVLGEMRRYLRDHAWSVRVPRGLQEDVLRITKATAELEPMLGRSPTPQELADKMGRDVEQIVEAITAGRAYTSASFEQRVDHDSERLTLGDTLGGDDAELGRGELRVLIRQLNAGLSEREQLVLQLRFEQDMTQTEIAQRIGVSQMQVSRILRATLDRLRAELRMQDVEALVA